MSENVNHAENHAAAFPQCKICIDTCPITVVNYAGANEFYQPKYEEHVVKLLVAISMNGYIVFVPPSLYGGRSADNVILEHSGFGDLLTRIDAQCLADGGFTLSDRVLIPYTKKQLFAGTPAESRERFKYNAYHAFYRARAEHPFAAARLGRFRGMMTCWKTGDFVVLRGAAQLACCVHNLAIFVKFGARGMYDPHCTAEGYKKSLGLMHHRLMPLRTSWPP